MSKFCSVVLGFLVVLVSSCDSVDNGGTNGNGSTQTEPCEATTGTCYYISPSGTDCEDAACGTIENPWATVAYAVTRTSPGDYVYLREGTHLQSMYGITFNSGSEGNYITYSGYMDEAVTLDITTTVRSELDLGGKSYLRFRNMKIYNGYVDDGVVRMRNGAHHISFENCDLQGDSAQGAVVLLYGENHHITLSDCAIHDNNPNPTSYNCVDVMEGTTYLTVENSRIYNCGHAAIMLWEGTSDNTIAHNEIYGEPGGVWGTGIIARGNRQHFHHNRIHDGVNAQCAKCALQWSASDSTIEYNVIYSTGRAGIALHDGIANNNVIRHNTMYNTGKYPGPDYLDQMCPLPGAPPLMALDSHSGLWQARDNQFYDNLIFFSGIEDHYGVSGYGYYQEAQNDSGDSFLGNTFHHNVIYYADPSDKVVGFVDDVTNLSHSMTIEEVEDAYPSSWWDNLQVDPLLTDPDNLNFSPKPESDACGAASDGTDIGALACGGEGWQTNTGASGGCQARGTGIPVLLLLLVYGIFIRVRKPGFSPRAWPGRDTYPPLR
jgi:parallel beta-helix repeat protein